MGMGGQRHSSAAFTPGKDPVPIVQEAELAPGPVWMGAENLAPTGFNPQTFQPVASHYTDYSIPAPEYLYIIQVKSSLPKIKEGAGHVFFQLAGMCHI
jgi:hypothetical protein